MKEEEKSTNNHNVFSFANRTVFLHYLQNKNDKIN